MVDCFCGRGAVYFSDLISGLEDHLADEFCESFRVMGLLGLIDDSGKVISMD